MLKPQRILELIESNKLTKKGFCDKVDISEQTLSNVLKGSDIGSKKLERIAIFFGVSMDVFFEREKPFKAYPSTHRDNEQQYKEKIALLERLLEEKDKRILLLEQMNQLINSGENRTNSGQTK